MQPPPRHRKTIRRFESLGGIHELTFSCCGHEPLIALVNAYHCLAVVVGRACATHGFELLAFVFMPDHVHIVVRAVHPAARVSNLLQAIKRVVSYRTHLAIESRSPELDRWLMHRERGGRRTFRFWQPGPGYDRNLVWPESVRNSIRYVHRNPVRKGIVEHPSEWSWSSWRQYAGYPDDDVLPRVTLFGG